MRIGVVSDSHGDVGILKQVIAAAGPVEHWLHAGDYYQDGWRLAEMTGLPLTVVAGNCDRTNAVLADEYIEIAGKKIWLTHGHRHNVKYGVSELAWWGRQYGVSIVVFGHTHIPYNSQQDGILLFNPGSPRAPRGGSKPSYGILDITENGTIEGSIREL
ncbi:metallophosphoesterase [Sporomusa sp.]|uniref:metallophosphoesterase n=1 Tax=Sporomusa sp. TaxID=2078658 RepID=UPI002C4F0D7C|nr:metallophosphoesterase [Sporomusa sp.]HWR42700.1 metallophosphoesterase [Sporomusa sp.]